MGLRGSRKLHLHLRRMPRHIKLFFSAPIQHIKTRSFVRFLFDKYFSIWNGWYWVTYFDERLALFFGFVCFVWRWCIPQAFPDGEVVRSPDSVIVGTHRKLSCGLASELDHLHTNKYTKEVDEEKRKSNV